MLGYGGGFWESWNSGHKVQFDALNKIININEGITSLDVKSDIYSAWKQWVLFSEANNMWQEQALRAVGGDPISDTLNLGSTFFLTNGWRIKPWIGHTNIAMNGNLYTEEGDRPVVADENGNDSVSFFVSNLVDTVIVDNSTGAGADGTAPTWDGAAGISNIAQNGALINCSWGTATDVSGVLYKVYISDVLGEIFTDASLLGSFNTNILSISTEADSVSPLRDVTYHVGVTAVDYYGNETTNTNTLSVLYSGSETAGALTVEQSTHLLSIPLSGLDANNTSIIVDIQTKVTTDIINKLNDILADVVDDPTLEEIENRLRNVKIHL